VEQGVSTGRSGQRGKAALGVVDAVQSEAQLLDVVLAVKPSGGLASGLHRRQKETDKDSDNGDDNQKLDEREALANAEAPLERNGHGHGSNSW